MMGAASVVAMGYRYPTPESAAELRSAVAELEGSPARHMDRFVSAVERLELGEWEELHTRTLDLSPLVIPYVGYVVWGENYRRGEFMADLKREMTARDVDLAGELPDHLAPVLRFLDGAASPPHDLIDELPGALQMMEKTLKKADPDNPYLHLLAATRAAVDLVLLPLETGGHR